MIHSASGILRLGLIGGSITCLLGLLIGLHCFCVREVNLILYSNFRIRLWCNTCLASFSMSYDNGILLYSLRISFMIASCSWSWFSSKHIQQPNPSFFPSPIIITSVVAVISLSSPFSPLHLPCQQSPGCFSQGHGPPKSSLKYSNFLHFPSYLLPP